MVAFRLLAVHGYRTWKDKTGFHLTSQAVRVCEDIQRAYQSKFDFIILIGGWHDKSLPSSESNATVMADRLIALGVPRSKIKVAHTDRAFLKSMSPRETAEEGALLARYLETQREREKMEYEVAVIAVREWIPRIKLIYAALKVPVSKFIAVEASPPLRFRLIEYGLRTIARFDPLGTGLVTGVLQRRIRRGRTLAGIPILQPLLPD